MAPCPAISICRRSVLRGIECRTGGASGIHQVIITFAAPVTVMSASVTLDPNASPAPTGSVSGYTVSGSQVTLNLTGVSNAQTILINLSGISDGTYTNNVSVRMGVLLGDMSGNGSVTATDISLAKLRSGQPVDASSFREDVSVDASINSSDISTVKSKSGTALP